MLPIATHQAKQIAGRAGRFGSGESVGLVTAYTAKEMNNLKEIIRQDIEDIQVRTIVLTRRREVWFSWLEHLPRKRDHGRGQARSWQT